MYLCGQSFPSSWPQWSKYSARAVYLCRAACCVKPTCATGSQVASSLLGSPFWLIPDFASFFFVLCLLAREKHTTMVSLESFLIVPIFYECRTYVCRVLLMSLVRVSYLWQVIRCQECVVGVQKPEHARLPRVFASSSSVLAWQNGFCPPCGLLFFLNKHSRSFTVVGC